MIQKQAKNRNETCSNLSLGTRLTVLSKRLRRKRCCDATPDRCQEGSRLTILLRIVKEMLRLLPKPRVGGIPGPEAHHEKNTPNVDACAEIHFQMKISDLSASTNPKKARFSSNSIFKLRSSTFYLQTALFKFYLQTAFFKIYLQTAFFKFYLQPSISALLSPDSSISSH